MSKPVAVDLYCGAGGMARGLQRAGFYVVGIDIDPQPNYAGDEFIHGDALELLRTARMYDFDAAHASPPCQGDSVMSKSWNGKAAAWPKLIGPTRDLLRGWHHLPYVIENVVGADLVDPTMLCGSMFDLPIERHRKFESNFDLPQPPCNHARQRELWPAGFPPLRSGREGLRARVVGIYGTGGGDAKDIDRWKWAMGIDWMQTKHELAESIPPAYGEYVGRHLMAALD